MTIRDLNKLLSPWRRAWLSNLRTGLVAGASIALTACPAATGLPSGNFTGNDTTAATRPVNATKSATSDDKQSPEKSRFEQFSDVPIPSSAGLNLEKTLVLGSDDGWIGRLDYDTPYAMAQMYSFFETEMPTFGWQPITVVRANVSTMTYTRQQRVVTLTLAPLMTGGTHVQMIMAPAVRGQNN